MTESSFLRTIFDYRVLKRDTLRPGFSVARLAPRQIGPWIDPFISIDMFEMSRPTFPPHPHAGFSAVTYVLKNSPGCMANRDSLGNKAIIEPGGTAWTQAARGMVHEESPAVSGTMVRGAQIFVNMPKIHKLDEPAAFHVRPRDVPTHSADGVVISAPFGGVPQGTVVTNPAWKAPRLFNKVGDPSMLDIEVRAGHEASILLDNFKTAFLIITDGEMIAQDLPPLPRDSLVILSREYGRIRLRSSGDGASSAHGLLFFGSPLGEPVMAEGPFVYTNEQELLDARRRFAMGGMGKLD